MKKIILLLGIVLSGTAFAEDSVVCDLARNGYVDLTIKDDGFLRVDSDDSLSLVSAEVQYLGSPDYQPIHVENTRLRDEETIVNIRLTFDQGTSVRQVYRFPMHKFSDGSELKVELSLISITGKVLRKQNIRCLAAQS